MGDLVLHWRTKVLHHESLIMSIIHFMTGQSEDIHRGYILYNFL